MNGARARPGHNGAAARTAARPPEDPKKTFAPLLCLALLVACGSPPPAPNAAPAPAVPAPAADPNVLAPNDKLVVQGIPPIPKSLVDEVAKYTDFRGHTFVDWHPTKREMLVAHRKAGAGTPQLFRLSAPMAEPEQLTDSADPVTQAHYEPKDGRYLVFERATGGDEADQIHRLDLDTRKVTLLTDPKQRHDFGAWLHRSSRMLYMSVGLDRAGGKQENPVQTITLMDPLQPAGARKLAELPGTGWFVGGVSWDDRQAALTRWISAAESQLWLLDLDSGKATQLLPPPGPGAKASYLTGGFKRDGSGLWVVSDRDGEFKELMFYRLGKARGAGSALVPVTRHIKWDVSGGTASDDGKLLALQANVEGRDEIRLFDARTLKELPKPVVPNGTIGVTEFHHKLPELAFSLNNSQGPSQVYSWHPVTKKAEQWTRAVAAPGVDMATFGDQQIVRWKSFDGRTISGLLNRPPARFTGKRPVLISIHGGPESQANFGFLGRANHFVQELGIVVVSPNVRGSAGYGKTFLGLDNGLKREDSVKDIGALLDWIATQPDLDASRVAVMGGSYGGYMSLAVATAYADRIASAVDVVGISNFVTFLRNTESYRRDLRRVEYGDERDEAMRNFLERISPLTNAQKITKPLFVVQGRNDPRVPYTEAEQIVAKVRGNGTQVWYLRAENEGHGFVRKENADFQFYATVMFLRETLLK